MRWRGSARTVALLNELPYVSTFALVLVTPFEKVQPFFSLAAMNFTNVEAVVLAALIVWAACLLLQRQLPRLRTEVTLPALLLLGVTIVSTLTASAYRGEALRFCGRFLAGLIVCLLIANVVTNRRRFHGILIAAGLSGAIVETISIVEHQQLPGVWSWLQSYKQGAFFVGGQLRSSSTLQYPTITSMYLEMVFGLGVSLLLLAMKRRRPILLLILLIALGLVTQGMILNLTRAGTISMVAMLILGTGLWWIKRKVDSGFWVLLGLVGLVGCLHVQALLQAPFYRLRLTKTQDKWYRAQYQVPVKLEFVTGQVHQVEVILTNKGFVTWKPQGNNPFRLSYHWLDQDAEKMLISEGLRTDLPRQVNQGESVLLHAQVQAPPKPGRYLLVWDLLQEQWLWFSTENSPSALSQTIVRGTAVSNAQFSSIPIPKPRLTVSRLTFWRGAASLFASYPFLGVGPDNFRWLYSHHTGLENWDPRLHSNNTYLEFFVGTGLIGGVIFLWFLWRVLKTLGQTWQTLGPEKLKLFVGLAMALSAFLLHGLVDSFFESTPTYLMIWTTVGLSISLKYLNKDSP